MLPMSSSDYDFLPTIGVPYKATCEMSPRIKHVWQRLPACYSVKHIARGKPSYIISNSTSQYHKCVIVNGNLTVAVSFICEG